MGTRSLTLFFMTEESKGPFAVMYRQYDGYPEGHGKDLAKLLSARKRINGIGDETAEDAANGIGCLAAQCVAYFKTGLHHDPPIGEIQIGEIYLTEYDKDAEGWQEFEYEIRPREDGWAFAAFAGADTSRRQFFSGTPADFLKKLEAGTLEMEE